MNVSGETSSFVVIAVLNISGGADARSIFFDIEIYVKASGRDCPDITIMFDWV